MQPSPCLYAPLLFLGEPAIGKNPAFQFYPSDWTRDLDDLDLEIEGAWIRILCRLWWSPERGKTTKPLREFARILRKTEKKTLKILHILIEKGVASGNLLDNQNLTIISRRMVKDDGISKIRQEVGKLGGNPKLIKKHKNLVNQTNNQNLTPSSSSSSSISSSNNYPDWLDLDLWQEFIKYRKKMRSPFTDHAEKVNLSKLILLKSQGNDPAEVINQTIERGWKAFFPVQKEKISTGNRMQDQNFEAARQFLEEDKNYGKER